MKDAAQLQQHLRLYENLQESRWTILKSKPAVRGHWVALAVAYHLGGNLGEARKVLEMYEDTIKVRTFSLGHVSVW